MLKADKLMRSLNHLLMINFNKLKAHIGFGQIGRHLECLIMTKDRVEYEKIQVTEEPKVE